MRARLALLLVGLAGCRTTRELRAAPERRVEHLTLAFSEPGAGRLHFELPGASCAQLPKVAWKLGLDGRTFATGLTATPQRTPEALLVDAPLSWRHLGWKDGERYARLRLTAEVRCLGEGEPTSWLGQAEVLVQGGPVLDSPRD